MTNPQLIDFIKQQLKEGLTKEKISGELLANGWTSQDVEEGFTAVDVAPATAPVQNPVSTPASVQAPNFMINPNISSPISGIMNSISRAPSVLKMKKHSAGRAIFITLTILLLLIAAAAYIFRDDLLNLPVVKDFLAIPDVALLQNNAEVPVTPQQETPDQTGEVPAVNPEITPSLSVYTDPNGLYSFSYPKGAEIKSVNDASHYPMVDLTIREWNDFPIIVVSSDVNDILTKSLTEANNTKSPFVDIDTYPSYKYVSAAEDIFGSYFTTYLIDLGTHDNIKLSILFSVISTISDLERVNQIETIVKSFVINKDNIASVAKVLLSKFNQVKQSFKDTVTKEAFMNTRAQAEVYFDKKSSYVDYCKSSEYSNTVKEVIKSTTLSCKDSVSAYAVRALISAGEYWCIDATGYSGSTSLSTGTACVK